MTKAEERAKEYAENVMLTVDHRGDAEEAYICGYEQAEKDNELTRENMFDIFRLVNEVLDDFAEGKTKKEVGEEVLKRFKDLKK